MGQLGWDSVFLLMDEELLSAIWYKTIKLSCKMNAEHMFTLSDLFYAAVLWFHRCAFELQNLQ